MMFGSYRKRLEADLTRWTGAGVITPAQATEIRRHVQAEAGGIKLPAVLGMLGGLLIASSVIAFVAANWQDIPRVAKLVAILLAIMAALATAVRLHKTASPLASDAAATAATLIFGAGVALVGQMYHLPADWPAGAVLVGIGALAVAFLLRSDGALVIAAVAAASWLLGRYAEAPGDLHPLYLAFMLPLALLALDRQTRLVHHVVMLAIGLWLVLAGGGMIDKVSFGALLAYWLGVAVVFIAIGHLAEERGGPGLLTAGIGWGLLGFIVTMGLQLARILDRGSAQAGEATIAAFLAGGAALLAVVALSLKMQDRRIGLTLAASLALALLLPLLFWSGIGATIAGRIVVAALVLISAALMVGAGVMAGWRRLTLTGSTLFAVAVIVLLYRTIGSLLDQSLFFLVGGALLIGMGTLARRLLRLATPAGETR